MIKFNRTIPQEKLRLLVFDLDGTLGDFFFQVYGGNSFPTKKPDPLGVNTLREECGCAAEETIIIGDSDIDILTARNAGIWSCGVTYGFAPHSLEAAPPDVSLDSTA